MRSCANLGKKPEKPAVRLRRFEHSKRIEKHDAKLKERGDRIEDLPQHLRLFVYFMLGSFAISLAFLFLMISVIATLLKPQIFFLTPPIIKGTRAQKHRGIRVAWCRPVPDDPHSHFYGQRF